MEIAVAGGTGVCGAFVVEEAKRRGHTARVLSRRPGPGGFAVDLSTGNGLAEALRGVDVLIDASNTTKPKLMREVLVTGTERLAQAGKAAGVRHHVLVSIVGIELTPMFYYRVKVEQEKRLVDSGVPATILRSTQFHQLLDTGFAMMSKMGMLPRSSIVLQPIDAAETAAALVDAAEQTPSGRVEIGGPQTQTLTELAKTWARAKRRHRLPLPLPLPGKLARPIRAGSLTAPDAPHGTLTFGDWAAR